MSNQGEGICIGTPMFFIRLAGCNFKCTFCDTQYSWTNGIQMTEEELVKQAIDSKSKWVCITGGEPMIQNIYKLVQLLKDARKYVMIETNGSKFNSEIAGAIDFMSISPKPGFYPDIKVNHYIDSIRDLIKYSKVAQLKFVIDNDKDVMTAIQYLYYIDTPGNILLRPPRTPICFQPNGMQKTKQYFDNLRELWKAVAELPEFYDWDIRVIPQLHRILFGQRRGV